MCYKKTQTKFLSGNTKKGNPDRRYIFLNISPERQNQKSTKKGHKNILSQSKTEGHFSNPIILRNDNTLSDIRTEQE